MMGYKTPNIDRIAREGAFHRLYGQQSCTAGRAAFITGQSPIRTGLTKVGLPGAKEGLQKEDPTPPICSSRSVTPLGSLVRITWAIATSSSPPCTASTIFRQLVPPERGARAGRSRLSERSEIRQQCWPARVRIQVRCNGHGKSRAAGPALRRVGKQTCEDTGPLTIKHPHGKQLTRKSPRARWIS